MRFLSFLLISCLFFANIVNAATLCCADMDNHKIEQKTKMPCHDSDDDKQSGKNEHKCECQGCTQFSNIVEPFSGSQFSTSSLELFHYVNFVSSPPGTIYHPPKYIS